MPPRPTSITIIGWLLVISGVITLITTTYSLGNPMVRELMAKSALPIHVQVSMMYAGAGVSLLCGLGILFRRRWARLLYTLWGAGAYAVGVMSTPQKMTLLPGFVLFLVVVFLLFRAAANAWFKAPANADASDASAS